MIGRKHPTCNRRAFVIGASAALLSNRSGFAQSADELDPEAVVVRLQRQLVEAMKTAEGMTVAERYEQLAPTLRDSFHFAAIARLTVGDHWADATTDQRKRLTEGVYRLTGSTLATVIDGFDEQRFEVRSVTDGPSNGVMIVDTMLIQPHSNNHRLSYLVARRNDRWGIVDAIIDGGISELNVRRSEYSRILREGGIEPLISALNAKADQLLKP